MAEQLICNQQVDGSTPFTSSNMGEFPSGQRGQTVNLLSLTSVVRIHLPPPTKKPNLSTRQIRLFCLSKPQAWHIISPCGAGYHHGNAVYLITRQRVSYLRLDDIQHFVLMIYRNKLRMIYTPSA